MKIRHSLAWWALALVPGCACAVDHAANDAATSDAAAIDAPMSDAPAGDAANVDAAAIDTSIDGGLLCPSLGLAYADPCRCATPPCCPHVTFDFLAGNVAASYLFCGDLVACSPAPIGWERQDATGAWTRVSSPGVSPTSGFQMAPMMWMDPWGDSVPMPPSGTVRAVSLFREICSANPRCAPNCADPYEVLSNAITVP